MALNKKKKILIAVISLLLVIGIGITVWKIDSTRWERTFEITYNGYDSTISNKSYKIYSITNQTNKTFEDVTAVIEVENWMNKKVAFEKVISHKIEPHETIEFKIYSFECQEALEKANLMTSISGSEIVKIKYK